MKSIRLSPEALRVLREEPDYYRDIIASLLIKSADHLAVSEDAERVIYLGSDETLVEDAL